MMVFLAIWLVIMTALLVSGYLKGKKALKIFPPLSEVSILYQEKRASGYSTKSRRSKIGGAQNSLEVIVTKNELWIRPRVILFAFVANDLTHRFHWAQVKNVSLKNNKQVIVTYQDGNHTLVDIRLQLKNAHRFLEATEKSQKLAS